ncbi:PiggyBac transposable element-derived protein like [Argiope bruennichi]|uniref:PiggyBac transposable element-derived protein like n=1 Tax=Argiope bruennichi TaxID=94029 RepID=A0A8T0DZC8_ARGBR|nr:PiggyBac transposable element-derived protein like [Argiope bruennichi]
MVLQWKDKKVLTMLSTIHNAALVSVESKISTTTKQKPKVVVDYNRSMGGVDKSDQCLAYYSSPRSRQRKYYKKIFRHLLDQAVWNAFLLYKKNGGSVNHLEFRMRLIERLCEEGRGLPSSKVPKSIENVGRLTGRHFPSLVAPTENKKYSARRCVVCCSKTNANGKRVRRETRFECVICKVGLCAAPCFEIYHTQSVF